MARMIKSKFWLSVLAIFLCAMSETAEAKRPFYVIAHMTNTTTAVNWALAKGANALEMDLRFTAAGEPERFQHSTSITEPCDCACTGKLQGDTVCAQLLHGPNGGIMGCQATVAVSEMFATLAAQQQLALVILDSKLSGADAAYLQERAGERIVQTLNADLFGKGYRGNVIISVGHPDAMSYLQQAAKMAAVSNNANRIYFAFDQEGGSAEDAACTLMTLAGLASKNRVFGTGISACAAGDFIPAIRTAAANRDAGVAGLVYVWTLDKKDSMRKYIDNGADGILTNLPGNLVEVAREKGLELAKPEDPIPVATNGNVVGGGGHCKCDCDYHPGGCRISKPARPGQACKCSYKGAWTCGGSVVACKNPNSPGCQNPDVSVASCVEGDGDCDGYKGATCDCNYEKGGCYISQVAPPFTACKCRYSFLWTCSGSLVPCANESSPFCIQPDASLASCQQGGGDCGAKRYK